MMRSLFSGVSGLKNHQVRMDVIGNNIANVNTLGFKAGRVTFKEGFAQLLEGASSPSEGQGGTNPRQLGLGMQIGSMDTIFTQGNLETTGALTDLAIQGDAFFVVSRGNENMYTRAGNFELDADGRLVSSTNGYRVQGRMAVDGALTQSVGDLRLPVGQQSRASATSLASIGGNLNASAEIGTQVESAITVYDNQGSQHELKVVFEKSAANEWTLTVDESELGGTVSMNGSNVLTFDPDTGLLTAPSSDPTISFTPTGATAAVDITLQLGAGHVAGLTQYAGTTSAALQEQDGHTAGTLQGFSIDRTGTILGAFSNGTSMVLGQIAMASFNNPGGLTRSGDNLYSISGNSGAPQVEFASENSASSIASGALEMSNVDLTQEFTNMIVAQRGFQANSRVITSTDEMLQEVVNLKR